ncbi:hypothetical protein SPHINGO361_100053 [Sphingomonas sp. EC-HK361]|nr:hypothetical protein SPHINGO361_100053 [Sphingomonas sp. EC-HK361]
MMQGIGPRAIQAALIKLNDHAAVVLLHSDRTDLLNPVIYLSGGTTGYSYISQI